MFFFFFFQAEDGIRDKLVTGVQTCALPISIGELHNFPPGVVMTAQPQGVLLSARLEKIRDKARLLRIHSLRATSAAGSGHPTSCLSAAELVAATFFHAMKFDPSDPNSLSSDRFVLSKGHAAPLLYAPLAEAGVFPISR